MSLELFLKENAKEVGVVKYAPSKRFLDKDGNPAEFSIRPISAGKDSEIRKTCFTQKFGKKATIEFDSELYIATVTASCVVEPNLNSEVLLESYGVNKATDLLKVMLTAGEFQNLSNKVQEINGFTTPDEDVEEAKN